ncbi:hypothetical protein [Sphingobacterium suaedae]|uniref:PilZ domain-containing protein n=1 Tax=Sphingobacterium suaedae TaxID=1686402 RepID=A0ABW5KIK8_9SPHI
MVGEQYPDILSYVDVNGNSVDVKCRFRPTRGTTFRKKQDGQEVQVSFDIAFPIDTPSIRLGTVFMATNERGEGFIFGQELLSFHVGSYHCLGSC